MFSAHSPYSGSRTVYYSLQEYAEYLKADVYIRADALPVRHKSNPG